MKQTNTANKQHALGHVQIENILDCQQSVKVSKVEYIGVADVYNMDVAEHENFSVNGGLIVHNSIDTARYSLESDMPRPDKKKIIRTSVSFGGSLPGGRI